MARSFARASRCMSLMENEDTDDQLKKIFMFFNIDLSEKILNKNIDSRNASRDFDCYRKCKLSFSPSQDSIDSEGRNHGGGVIKPFGMRQDSAISISSPNLFYSECRNLKRGESKKNNLSAISRHRCKSARSNIISFEPPNVNLGYTKTYENNSNMFYDNQRYDGIESHGYEKKSNMFSDNQRYDLMGSQQRYRYEPIQDNYWGNNFTPAFYEESYVNNDVSPYYRSIDCYNCSKFNTHNAPKRTNRRAHYGPEDYYSGSLARHSRARDSSSDSSYHNMYAKQYVSPKGENKGYDNNYRYERENYRYASPRCDTYDGGSRIRAPVFPYEREYSFVRRGKPRQSSGSVHGNCLKKEKSFECSECHYEPPKCQFELDKNHYDPPNCQDEPSKCQYDPPRVNRPKCRPADKPPCAQEKKQACKPPSVRKKSVEFVTTIGRSSSCEIPRRDCKNRITVTTKGPKPCQQTPKPEDFIPQSGCEIPYKSNEHNQNSICQCQTASPAQHECNTCDSITVPYEESEPNVNVKCPCGSANDRDEPSCPPKSCKNTSRAAPVKKSSNVFMRPKNSTSRCSSYSHRPSVSISKVSLHKPGDRRCHCDLCKYPPRKSMKDKFFGFKSKCRLQISRLFSRSRFTKYRKPQAQCYPLKSQYYDWKYCDSVSKQRIPKKSKTCLHKIRKSVSCVVTRNKLAPGRPKRNLLAYSEGPREDKQLYNYTTNRKCKCIGIAYPTVYREANKNCESQISLHLDRYPKLNRASSGFTKVNSHECPQDNTSKCNYQNSSTANGGKKPSKCNYQNSSTANGEKKPSKVNITLTIRTNDCKLTGPPQVISNESDEDSNNCNIAPSVTDNCSDSGPPCPSLDWEGKEQACNTFSSAENCSAKCKNQLKNKEQDCGSCNTPLPTENSSAKCKNQLNSKEQDCGSCNTPTPTENSCAKCKNQLNSKEQDCGACNTSTPTENCSAKCKNQLLEELKSELIQQLCADERFKESICQPYLNSTAQPQQMQCNDNSSQNYYQCYSI